MMLRTYSKKPIEHDVLPTHVADDILHIAEEGRDPLVPGDLVSYRWLIDKSFGTVIATDDEELTVLWSEYDTNLFKRDIVGFINSLTVPMQVSSIPYIMIDVSQKALT
jgi:hypothetical protein